MCGWKASFVVTVVCSAGVLARDDNELGIPELVSGVGGIGGEEGNREFKQCFLFLHGRQRENEFLDIYCSLWSLHARSRTDILLFGENACVNSFIHYLCYLLDSKVCA